jgi:predicted nucleic acid-binding protein
MAQRYDLNYWDGLLLATARLNGIPSLVSEDMQHRGLYDGVRVLNPFATDFDLAQLS